MELVNKGRPLAMRYHCYLAVFFLYLFLSFLQSFYLFCYLLSFFMILKELMSHPENKKIMCQFFLRMVISELGSLQKLCIDVHGTEIISNIPEWDIESHSQHEADTLLLLKYHEKR